MGPRPPKAPPSSTEAGLRRRGWPGRGPVPWPTTAHGPAAGQGRRQPRQAARLRCPPCRAVPVRPGSPGWPRRRPATCRGARARHGSPPGFAAAPDRRPRAAPPRRPQARRAAPGATRRRSPRPSGAPHLRSRVCWRPSIPSWECASGRCCARPARPVAGGEAASRVRWLFGTDERRSIPRCGGRRRRRSVRPCARAGSPAVPGPRRSSSASHQGTGRWRSGCRPSRSPRCETRPPIRICR